MGILNKPISSQRPILYETFGQNLNLGKKSQVML